MLITRATELRVDIFVPLAIAISDYLMIKYFILGNDVISKVPLSLIAQHLLFPI